MKTIYTLFCLFFALNIHAQNKTTKVHINHTAVFVIDMNKTAEFYSKIIGLETIPEPFHDGQHLWFKTGELSAPNVGAGVASRELRNTLGKSYWL